MSSFDFETKITKKMKSCIPNKMNLTKYIIGGKIPNYLQTVYCSAGEVPDDRNNVLLGYHESLPVVSNKSTSVALSAKKTTVKVEVDPDTGNKFIRLNGKRLRMLSDSEIPSFIKHKTQNVKLTASTTLATPATPAVTVPKEDRSLSKTISIPREMVLNSAKESHVYLPNKNGANGCLPQSSLIKSTKLINVENPITDAIPQTTDNTSYVQISSDKHSNTSSTFNVVPKTFTKLIIRPTNQTQSRELTRMQPIDLTKHNKYVETDRKQYVNIGIQVNIDTTNENPLLLEEFDKFNAYLGLVDILNLDPQPSTPKRIMNSPLPNDPAKQLTTLSTVSQQSTGKHKLAASFYAELRGALIRDDKGNMPIHVGVLMNNLGLVRRSWFILKILKQSVDVLNNNDYTPLQLAIINNTDNDIVTLLVGAGAKLDYCDSDGNNILHLAVEYQRTDALKILLNYVEDAAVLDQHNHEGLSPLIMCASSGQLQSADLLLEGGAEINLKDQISGRTALFHAAENIHQDMVQLLLNHGADTKIKNFFGTSPHDAMYDVDEIPEAIKLMILGRSMKRKFVEDVKNSHRLKKKEPELKTYSRLQKINSNGLNDASKRGTVIHMRHMINANLKHL